MSTHLAAATDIARDDELAEDVVTVTDAEATAPDQIEPEAPAADLPEPEAPAEVEHFDPVAEALAAIATNARSRGFRTLLQGAIAAALMALATVAATYLRSGDLAHLDYKALGTSAATAVGAALVSYLHNALGNKR
jgi:hypothetical protein